MDREADIADACADTQIMGGEQDLPLRRDSALASAAEEHLRPLAEGSLHQPVQGHVFPVEDTHYPASAQDRAPIAEREDLLEAMRHVDKTDAVPLQIEQDREEP